MDKFVVRTKPATSVNSLSNIDSLESETASTSTAKINRVPADLNMEGPSQPTTCTFPKDKNNRSFRPVWYNSFCWLEYSCEGNAAFCYPCRRFLIPNRETKETAFTSTGYRNWKTALGDKRIGLPLHESTTSHIKAMVLWEELKFRLKSGQSVSTLVNDRQLERNRYYVSSVIKVVRFLVSNELALRGGWDKSSHSETGLFTSLSSYTLKTDSKLVEVLKTISANAQYTSWLIQNEVIEAMNEVVAEDISEEIWTADVPW